MAPTEWATVAEVFTATGRNVTQMTRDLAAQSIEMHTGLIEDVVRVDITDRDRYWLKLTTAYQAVWIAAQPDYLERSAVMSVSQDGQSVTGANPDWLTLSPQARKCIKRLSWRGVRTVSIQRADRTALNVNSEEFDDSLDWRRA